MSVIGLSPGDIVAGLNVVTRGIEALKEDGGSKTQYRQYGDGLESGLRATHRLGALASSLPNAPSASALRESTHKLHDQYKESEQKARKYNEALSPQSKKGFNHGVFRKLQFEFRGRDKIRDRAARSALGANAVVLDAFSFEHEAANARSVDHNTAINTAQQKLGTLAIANAQADAARIVDLSHQVGDLALAHNTSSQAEAAILSGLSQQMSDLTVANTTSSQAEAARITGLSQEMGCLALANNTSFAGAERRLKRLESEVERLPDLVLQVLQREYAKFLSTNAANLSSQSSLPQQDSQRDQDGQHPARCCVKLQSSVEQTVSKALTFVTSPNVAAYVSSLISVMPRGDARLYPAQAIYPSSLIATSTEWSENLVAAILLAACGAVYQSSAVQAVLQKLKTRTSKDPLFMAMMLLAAYYLAKTLSQVPKQISLLCDSSIYFQDALGSPAFRVPAAYWQHVEIFHGFISNYFRERPGSQYVETKQYRLLRGRNELGEVIDEGTWKATLKARMYVTMAIVVDLAGWDKQYECPKCSMTIRRGTESTMEWYPTSSPTLSKWLTFFSPRCNQHFPIVEVAFGEEQTLPPKEMSDASPRVKKEIDHFHDTENIAHSSSRTEEIFPEDDTMLYKYIHARIKAARKHIDAQSGELDGHPSDGLDIDATSDSPVFQAYEPPTVVLVHERVSEDGTPEINHFKAFLDSGADVSLVSEEIVDRFRLPYRHRRTDKRLMTASGRELVLGMASTLTFRIKGLNKLIKAKFYVMPRHLCTFDFIIGDAPIRRWNLLAGF